MNQNDQKSQKDRADEFKGQYRLDDEGEGAGSLVIFFVVFVIAAFLAFIVYGLSAVRIF